MMEQLTDNEKFLLLGKITGTLSPEEAAALEQLLLTNPHIHTAYHELAAALPAEDVATGFARRKVDPTWRDLRSEFQVSQTSAHIIPVFKRKWPVAAVVAGALVTSSLLFWQFGKFHKTSMASVSKPAIELKLANGQVINLSREQGAIDAGTTHLNNNNKSLSYDAGSAPATGINTLTIPIGLDYKLNLADGSEVWLNSATQISFPLAFTGNYREISINGEAYVKVTKDAAKPFIVHLPHSTVEVMGTEFNVNTYDSGTVKVALVVGAVNLAAPSGKSSLKPGNEAVYKTNQAIAIARFDARNVLSWREGLFYFEDATLEEISKVVPRWYGVQVVIDNPALLSRTFSGVINRNHPIEVFMEDLKVISGIASYKDQHGVLHFT